MVVFKCKMCGGTIEFNPGDSVGICDSCGTKQTLPRLDDDRRANLYDRANHFRRNNDFDKAVGLYEQILNEDPTDAEAYWSLVLCRYGIEYVEDPATHKRVPTVNRTQFTSIFDDEDYKSALQHADGYQHAIYEEEAAAINEIQKGILAISQKEKPFDVFICYKETDAAGRRTQDSVLANDLFHQLTNEGFKVFFSRITLEDKLGTAYEPYIFAALNSAKAMIVLGTKPEYFNAVWVKNEWSRYLSLVKQSGGKKVLIPAYRDMDPYDLPDEFSHLQAQDMSKLGFMQDLIRGIKKIVRADEQKAMAKETIVTGSAVNTASLLKRAFMFLEDEEWSRADEFCEQVLNQEPENAQAYLGKLLSELRIRSLDCFADEWIKRSDKEASYEIKCVIPPESNVNDISQTVQEYSLADWLTEEKIREQFDMDLSYKSFADYRRKNLEYDEIYFAKEPTFQKILRFADDELRGRIIQIKEQIITVQKQRLQEAESADMDHIQQILAIYQEKIRTGREDAKILYEKALTKKEEYERDQRRQNELEEEKYYKKVFESAEEQRKEDTINGLERAISKYEEIESFYNRAEFLSEPSYVNLPLRIQTAKKRIEVLRKKPFKRAIIVVVVCSIIVASVFGVLEFCYRTGVLAYKEGDYELAESRLRLITWYRDAQEYYSDNVVQDYAQYKKGKRLLKWNKNYDALQEFWSISYFEDAADYLDEAAKGYVCGNWETQPDEDNYIFGIIINEDQFVLWSENWQRKKKYYSRHDITDVWVTEEDGIMEIVVNGVDTSDGSEGGLVLKNIEKDGFTWGEDNYTKE